MGRLIASWAQLSRPFFWLRVKDLSSGMGRSRQLGTACLHFLTRYLAVRPLSAASFFS